MPTRTFTSPHPVDLRVTLSPLVHGRDPTIALAHDRVVRAWRTPEGGATLAVRAVAGRFEAESWGAGAEWALAQAPAFVGVEDDASSFDPSPHPLVARAHRRRPGLRFGRTGTVADVLVPTILGQKVTSLEAVRAWARMVRWWGEPAPGPFPELRLPPEAGKLATTPYWEFHRLGVERKRAVIVIDSARRMSRLEEAVTMAPADALRRLTALPGLGPWTAGLVMRQAMGDPDAVEVGDFHIPNHVAWNLAGEPRGDDTRMLELLEPFRGHRGRVVRLLGLEGRKAPAFGPRTPVRGVEHL